MPCPPTQYVIPVKCSGGGETGEWSLGHEPIKVHMCVEYCAAWDVGPHDASKGTLNIFVKPFYHRLFTNWRRFWASDAINQPTTMATLKAPSCNKHRE